jgi:hypothetical protein
LSFSLSKQSTTSLVFYDWASDIDPKRWVELSEWFSNSVGYPINRIVATDIKGRSVKVKKGDYDAIEGKASLSVYSLRPPYTNMREWDCISEISLISKGKKTAIMSYVTSCHDTELLIYLTVKTAEIADLRYGHSLVMPHDCGPEYYLQDMMYSTDNFGLCDAYYQSDLMMKWIEERNISSVACDHDVIFRHAKSLLRDVYPLNIVTRSHMSTLNGGVSLLHEIINKWGLGRIVDIGHGLLAWIIPMERIPEARTKLKPTGLLIAV